MTVIARFCPYCGLGLEEQVGHEPWVVTILKCPACGYLHMTPKERRVFEMLGLAGDMFRTFLREADGTD